MSNEHPTGAQIDVTFTDGLRALADLLDERNAAQSCDQYRHLVPVSSAEEIGEWIRKLGGRWEKEPIGDYFGMVRDLGGGVTVTVYAPRTKVCERVVTGTRKVLRPAEPHQVATVEVPMVEVEEPIVEWVCPPSILAAGGAR